MSGLLPQDRNQRSRIHNHGLLRVSVWTDAENLLLLLFGHDLPAVFRRNVRPDFPLQIFHGPPIFLLATRANFQSRLPLLQRPSNRFRLRLPSHLSHFRRQPLDLGILDVQRHDTPRTPLFYHYTHELTAQNRPRWGTLNSCASITCNHLRDYSRPDRVPARKPVSYTHLRAHETGRNLVCR